MTWAYYGYGVTTLSHAHWVPGGVSFRGPGVVFWAGGCVGWAGPEDLRRFVLNRGYI